MNWVSSQISAQFSSSSSYPCSFRPSRAGGAGLLSTYLSIYLPISIYVYLYSDPPEVAVLGSGLVHASVGWTVNISCQVTHRVDICVKTVDLYCNMLKHVSMLQVWAEPGADVTWSRGSAGHSVTLGDSSTVTQVQRYLPWYHDTFIPCLDTPRRTNPWWYSQYTWKTTLIHFFYNVHVQHSLFSTYDD